MATQRKHKPAGGKHRRSGRDIWIVLLLTVLLLAIIALVFVVLFQTEQTPDETSTSSTVELQCSYDIDGFTPLPGAPIGAISDELELLYAGTYSGAYMEDGTDEQVTDVLALIVENKGSATIEYAQLCLMCDEKPVYFSVTALPATGKVFVLAQDRAAYTTEMRLGALTCTQSAALSDRAVLDFGGEFRLYPSDGVLNLQNISQKDIAGDVSLYFKNYRDGLFWGGITYRVSFADGFAADETRQSVQPHYTVDGSVILYMSYEDA